MYVHCTTRPPAWLQKYPRWRVLLVAHPDLDEHRGAEWRVDLAPIDPDKRHGGDHGGGDTAAGPEKPQEDRRAPSWDTAGQHHAWPLLGKPTRGQATTTGKMMCSLPAQTRLLYSPPS